MQYLLLNVQVAYEVACISDTAVLSRLRNGA